MTLRIKYAAPCEIAIGLSIARSAARGCMQETACCGRRRKFSSENWRLRDTAGKFKHNSREQSAQILLIHMHKTFALQPHPTTPCAFVTAIEVVADLSTTDIACRYTVHGAIDRLAIPAASSAPKRTDGLWQQTCFEIFLRQAESDAYTELNFSPSGDWAAYRLRRYREGMAGLEVERPPTILREQASERFVLRTAVDTGLILPARLGLSVVLKDVDGHTYYWALRHPAGKPDFHHEDAFVVLESPA